MIPLTVFTPTFNRAHTLERTFDSLCRQTCKDFKWLIIDDGSTDNTKELVKHWSSLNSGFEIDYVWKENGGLHTGYNKAIELMNSKLCVCIDSDDYMPDDAVEKIIACWEERGEDNVAGIIGLDFTQDGSPLRGWLPDIEKCHYYELAFKYNHTEDTKPVIRVDLLKRVAPQPTYFNEKHFNPSYMINQIDFDFEWLILNSNLCFVDYQPDGMASSIYNQYLDSPNSFAAIRINNLKTPSAPLLFFVKQYIHLGASAVLSSNFTWLLKAPNKLLSIAFLPVGWLLSLYIRLKAHNKR